VTLTTGWDDRWKLQNELQLSMLRCTSKHQSQLDDQCELFVRYYDEHDECYKFETPKRGGCAYHQDIIILVPPSYVDTEIGYERLPKVFLHAGSRQGYRRWLATPIKPSPPSAMDQPVAHNTSKKSVKKGSATSASSQEKIWWYLDKLPSIEECIQSAESAIAESNEDRVKESSDE
jgi:hypothetical protein